jgi:bilirubin oxidase
MMAAMNVTALSDLGYDEKTSFIDPMEQRYRAKSFSDTDYNDRAGDFTGDAIQKKVAFFNGLDAYRNVKEVESRLEDYWKTASSGSAGSFASSTVAAVAASSAAPLSVASSSASASAVAGATASRTTSAAMSTTVSSTTLVSATSTTKKADDKTKKTSTTSTTKKR